MKEWRTFRAGGLNAQTRGARAYAEDGAEPVLCGYSALLPRIEIRRHARTFALAQGWYVFDPEDGALTDTRVIGHHQRLQTTSRGKEPVALMCEQAARRIAAMLEASPGSRLIPAARFYAMVCSGGARPMDLVSASYTMHCSDVRLRRIFLASDRFSVKDFGPWRDSPSTIMYDGDRPTGNSMSNDPFDTALGKFLSRSNFTGDGHVAVLTDEATPVLIDMMLETAADEFWPTPGSTMSETLCFWRKAWQATAVTEPKLESCEQLVLGWGTDKSYSFKQIASPSADDARDREASTTITESVASCLATFDSPCNPERECGSMKFDRSCLTARIPWRIPYSRVKCCLRCCLLFHTRVLGIDRNVRHWVEREHLIRSGILDKKKFAEQGFRDLLPEDEMIFSDARGVASAHAYVNEWTGRMAVSPALEEIGGGFAHVAGWSSHAGEKERASGGDLARRIANLGNNFSAELYGLIFKLSDDADLDITSLRRIIISEEVAKVLAVNISPQLAGNPVVGPIPRGLASSHDLATHWPSALDGREAKEERAARLMCCCMNVDSGRGRETRRQKLQTLYRNGLLECADPDPSVPHSEYINQMLRSRFVISPPGNGRANHREWEALIAGAVPVVEYNPAFEPMYETLPVVRVNNWTEVTPAFLERQWALIHNASAQFDMAPLYWPYWLAQLTHRVSELSSGHLSQKKEVTTQRLIDVGHKCPNCSSRVCLQHWCQSPPCQPVTLNMLAENGTSTWHGRVLRITGPLRDGFWVRALTVIGQAAWAVERNMGFFVHQNSSFDPYYDSSMGSSSWDSFFLPISVKDGGANPPPHEHDVVELDCEAAWHIFTHDAGGLLYPKSLAIAEKNRKKRSAQVARWVRVRPEILAKADSLWRTLSLDTSGPVLGVHLRGTDKHLQRKVPPQEYFEVIDAWLQHATRNKSTTGTPRIFLATDDYSHAHTMEARYGELIAQQPTPYRGSSQENRPNPHLTSQGSAYTKGLQVMIDTLLLSRVDFLVMTNSAVTEFAMYFNSSLHDRSFNFNIADSTRPGFMPRRSRRARA